MYAHIGRTGHIPLQDNPVEYIEYTKKNFRKKNRKTIASVKK